MKNVSSEDYVINIEKISYSYENQEIGKNILHNFNLSVCMGEIVCIVGPNGCGKSTLLKLCSRLLEPQNGKIYSVSNKRKKVGYLPQLYAESLMPWLNALDNIAFALYANGGASKRLARIKARDIIKKLPFNIPLEHFPNELSGGQQQMVCLARTLLVQPSLMLIDEPFSALDQKTQHNLQSTLHHLFPPTSKLGIIMVTHEIADAVFMADRILIVSSTPMNTIKEFINPCPRPRSREYRKSDDFFSLIRKIMTTIEDYVK